MQPKPSEEPALGPGHIGPRHAIRLLVDVERRVGVLAERPIGAPAGKGPGRAPVAVVRLVAGLFGGLVEPHHVGRMALQKACLFGGVDDVVGRRDDQREVGDGRRVVAQRSERTDVGHVTSRNRPVAGGSRDRPIVR